MTVVIRRASETEHSEAGRVTADAYREFVRPGDADWDRYLERIANVAERAERTTVLIAVEDGRILGSLTLELDGRVRDSSDAEHRPLADGEAHIRMLGVDPEARGRGVARALMERSEAIARAAGKTVMTLNTTKRMVAARAMYERLGYERTADTVFPDGFVLLGYEKPLR
ncbi:MAG TPA: GNAT family N-acetyltransferase [Actinomycetota bacterium]|jgi:ribosomal protein S18 acetylase RimI-like enzyme|nr:GNAT family N-acetyltransferase [Actinomycetota bacterium]